ncbi:hypothetical protein KIPB_005816, partial [Kipferlia bialata]|eukprot:g5816.t1
MPHSRLQRLSAMRVLVEAAQGLERQRVALLVDRAEAVSAELREVNLTIQREREGGADTPEGVVRPRDPPTAPLLLSSLTLPHHTSFPRGQALPSKAELHRQVLRNRLRLCQRRAVLHAWRASARVASFRDQLISAEHAGTARLDCLFTTHLWHMHMVAGRVYGRGLQRRVLAAMQSGVGRKERLREGYLSVRQIGDTAVAWHTLNHMRHLLRQSSARSQYEGAAETIDALVTCSKVLHCMRLARDNRTRGRLSSLGLNQGGEGVERRRLRQYRERQMRAVSVIHQCVAEGLKGNTDGMTEVAVPLGLAAMERERRGGRQTIGARIAQAEREREAERGAELEEASSAPLSMTLTSVGGMGRGSMLRTTPARLPRPSSDRERERETLSVTGHLGSTGRITHSTPSLRTMSVMHGDQAGGMTGSRVGVDIEGDGDGEGTHQWVVVESSNAGMRSTLRSIKQRVRTQQETHYCMADPTLALQNAYTSWRIHCDALPSVSTSPLPPATIRAVATLPPHSACAALCSIRSAQRSLHLWRQALLQQRLLGRADVVRDRSLLSIALCMWRRDALVVREREQEGVQHRLDTAVARAWLSRWRLALQEKEREQERRGDRAFLFVMGRRQIRAWRETTVSERRDRDTEAAARATLQKWQASRALRAWAGVASNRGRLRRAVRVVIQMRYSRMSSDLFTLWRGVAARKAALRRCLQISAPFYAYRSKVPQAVETADTARQAFLAWKHLASTSERKRESDLRDRTCQLFRRGMLLSGAFAGWSVVLQRQRTAQALYDQGTRERAVRVLAVWRERRKAISACSDSLTFHRDSTTRATLFRVWHDAAMHKRQTRETVLRQYITQWRRQARLLNRRMPRAVGKVLAQRYGLRVWLRALDTRVRLRNAAEYSEQTLQRQALQVWQAKAVYTRDLKRHETAAALAHRYHTQHRALAAWHGTLARKVGIAALRQ